MKGKLLLVASHSHLGSVSTGGCSDLFPTNDIDAGDCDEEDDLTLVEKDRIIRSLETEVEAQVILIIRSFSTKVNSSSPSSRPSSPQ